jgi:hypothetical protein
VRAKKLCHCWFVFRDVHSDQGLPLLQPRWAYSFMRDPMTLAEVAVHANFEYPWLP